MEELDRLVKFLGLDIEESLKKEIQDMCEFEKMAQDRNPEMGVDKTRVNEGFTFFRKGK